MYSDFRGVDFRGGEVDLARSPDALNMWKDYKQPDRLIRMPDFSQIGSFDGPIHSIKFWDDERMERTDNSSKKKLLPLVIAGSSLYAGYGNMQEKIGVLPSQPGFFKGSSMFIFNDVAYIKTGISYIQYDGTTVKQVEGYIPTTSINRNPSGGGVINEDVNLLTRRRKNTFRGDGTSTVFYLDTDQLDASEEPIVTVDGKPVALATPSWGNNGGNSIRVASAPPVPTSTGDNVCIEFSVLEPNDYPKRSIDKIWNCSLATVFDNRVFFSGNPHYPNTVWHSSLDDPTYVSDLDYYIEGQDGMPVTAMVAGNNALWVLKKPSPENNSIFYHVPTIDSEYGKIYPSTHSNIATGCVGSGANFNDDIVFFSDNGMEGISGDITTEQVISHRSSMVDAKLLKEENYENMILEEWNGYLLVFIGNKVYLADSRAMHQIENHFEYEWFYWELETSVICTAVHDGILYAGTEDGYLYRFVEGRSSRGEAYWTTPMDKFGYPHFLKTTNKRGCVIEGTKLFDIYVRTNKSEWEKIGAHKNGADYTVCRTKKKKFREIQMKFHAGSGEPPYNFSIKSATLECYIGGYVKR